MGDIVDKFVAQLAASLKEKRVDMALTDAGRAWLATRGYDPAFGARPLSRVMREEVEDELASEVLFGKLASGGRVLIDAESRTAEKLVFVYGELAVEGGAPKRLAAGKAVKLLPAETGTGKGFGKGPAAGAGPGKPKAARRKAEETASVEGV